MSGFIKFFRRQSKPKVAVDTPSSPSNSSVASGSPVSSTSLRIGTPGSPPPAPPPPSFQQLLSMLSALPFLPAVPYFAEAVAEYALGGVERTFSSVHIEPNPRGRAIDSLEGDYFRTNVPVESRSRFLRVQRIVVTRWTIPMDGGSPSTTSPSTTSPPRPAPSFPRLSALSANLQRLSISEREGERGDDDDSVPSAAENRPLLLHDLDRNPTAGPPSLTRAQTSHTPGSPQLHVEASTKVYDRLSGQYGSWLDSLKPGDPVRVANKALGYRVRVFKVRVNIVCLFQYSPEDSFSPMPAYSDSPIPISRHLLDTASPTGAPRILHKSQSAPMSMQQLADLVMQEEGAARTGSPLSPSRQEASPPPFNAPLPSMFRPVPSLLSSGSNISLSAASEASVRSNVYSPEPVATN